MATFPIDNATETFLREPGEPVRIPDPIELTTQQTSELLNLSCEYVQRLIDEGKIPSHQVGDDHLLRLEAVLQYKQKSDADRLDALKRLVAEAQELNMG